MSAPSTSALTKLQTAALAALAVIVLRRATRRRRALQPSLSERWSASTLSAMLRDLRELSPRPGSAPSSPAEPRVAPSLSRTWSAERLGAFLSAFIHGPREAEAPDPAESTALARAVPRYSWHDFQEDSLHHPGWGYYSDGRVVFGESSSAADFTTFPVSMRPAFGAMLADRLHSLWLATGGGDSAFVVLELGAGTGVLAHDVLAHIASAHPSLYACLTYVIGERSASLRAAQTETNAGAVGGGKLQIVPADARDLGSGRMRARLAQICGGAPLRGAVLSNELPDAFGVEKVLVGMQPPAAGGGLTLQRASVLPLIREAPLRRIIAALRAASPARPDAGAIDSCEALLRDSRAARAGLAEALAAGRTELGRGGAQLLPTAAAALAEWLAEPPAPDPDRDPARDPAPLHSFAPARSSPLAPAAPDGAAPSGEGEWVLLSREAYGALKGRCCAAADAPAADGGASGGGSADACGAEWGTPLERSLDGAVCICEVYDDVATATQRCLKVPPGHPPLTVMPPGSPPSASPKRQPRAAELPATEADASLHRWLGLHSPLLSAALERLPAGTRLEVFPSPSLPSLAAGLAALLDEGAVITIDYGADATTLINSAQRVPPRGTAPSSPTLPATRSGAGMRVCSRLHAAPGEGRLLTFRRPGAVDLTTDVDFTELAATGEAHGLRTLYFGPQTALQRVLPPGAVADGCGGRPAEAEPCSPLRVTDASPPLRRGVVEAFYSLGTFVMLVQGTPGLAERWAWTWAPLPLYTGQASVGALSLLSTLRTLGRLTLEHALRLQAAAGGGASKQQPPPSERELAVAMADALLPNVPCFRSHWKRMRTEVLALLAGAPSGAAKLPPLYAPALRLVEQDLQLMRGAA